MRDIDQLGMREVSRRALEVVNAGAAGFHISFDLDGCDPEVVELNSFLDHANISAERAVTLIQSAFGRNII